MTVSRRQTDSKCIKNSLVSRRQARSDYTKKQDRHTVNTSGRLTDSDWIEKTDR